ncbi:uncharacterized protein LOC131848245 [Achroia grisella]|uniref:uncharacterized protein LOC131848245 n=1 Tax=Achroia grisella TaxID=688607 RepID=UPI0027D320DB|nr:uncharacterized protein LOC131848245 [Achroia grisella]
MEGIRILRNYMKNFITNQAQDTATQPECIVSDATALVLCVSRIAGIAPLRFRRHRDGWLISVSPFAFVYSIIITSIIVSMGIAGLILDLEVDPSRSLRARSPTRRMLWIADFTVVILTMLVGVIGGPLRMNDMIRYLNQTNKIKMSIDNIQPVILKRRKHVILTLLSIIAFGLILIGEYYMAYNLAIQFGTDLFSAVEALNEPLSSLLNIAESKQNYISFTQKPRRHCETVRHLALSYIKLCLVVKEVNKCHAVTVLLMFCNNLTHLIIAPYYLLLTLFTPSPNPALLLVEMSWCVAHIISLLMVVEPCHWTQEEASRTQTLVSRLTARLAGTDPSLATELTKFFKHLILNKIIYSPLGICQLTRSLCASITGSLTTYLVILLQFQSMEEKKEGPG